MSLPHSPRLPGGALLRLAWLLVCAACTVACRKSEGEAAPPRAVAVDAAAPAAAPPTYPPCGESGQPDCPLAAWMDAGPNNFMHNELTKPLAGALRRLATIEPAGYPEWDTWALAGAEAADREDTAAVKRACTGCHDQYRARYRRELRGRPISISTGLPDAGAPPEAAEESGEPASTKGRRRRN